MLGKEFSRLCVLCIIHAVIDRFSLPEALLDGASLMLKELVVELHVIGH